MIKAYCDESDAKFSSTLKPFLERIATKDVRLAKDKKFIKILKTTAGEDPAMIRVQDRMFDNLYWLPSVQKAESIGIKTPLGILAVFDTNIHMGNSKHDEFKDETMDNLDGTPITGIDEKKWITVYLQKRRTWLVKSRIPTVRKTAYRVEELLKLASSNNWILDGPITILGETIT